MLPSLLSTTALALALAVRAWAHKTGPSDGGWGGKDSGYSGAPCLNATGVSTVIDGYTYLLEHPGGPYFNSTAEALLADDFVVYSDSILTLSNRSVRTRSRYLTRSRHPAALVLMRMRATLTKRPQRQLGQPAYPSKEVYIATQFQTPPLPVVQTLGVFATCNQVSWRWNASGIGSNKFEIKGIIAFDVNPASVQIDTVYSEFNTAAFEADLGA